MTAKTATATTNGVVTSVWREVANGVERTLRATTSSAKNQDMYRGHLAAFAAWALETGWRPGDNQLLDADRIERYTAVGMPTASDGSRATRRSILRRIALKTSPELRDVPDREPIGYRRIPPPYSQTEVDGLLRLAGAQPTAGRTRSVSAILRLGLGCGLDCRDLGWVRGCDVAVDAQGVHVTVTGGSRPRTVTTLAAYQYRVGALASDRVDLLLIGGAARPRRNITSTAISRMLTDSTVPPLVVGRLRSTWLLTHLELRTPLPVLMAAAGLQTVRPLEDLLEHARAFNPAEAAAWLRGGG